MTVNQSSFAYFLSMDPREAGQMLDRLREITGVQDQELLTQALDASRDSRADSYDVERAVHLLVENSRSEAPVAAAAAPAPAGKAEPQPALMAEPASERKVRFRTSDTADSDLTRAIKLSLLDRTPDGAGAGAPTASGFSREEEEIAKVLEASYEEQNAGTKRKRGSPWVDSLNPMERKREADWPVGLKNVGNTCWFSAVVQSLFHLPAFRGLVLRYRPVKRDRQSPEEERTAQFMLELRRLFALLVASEKRYVDPSAAVDLLKKVLDGGATDSQQDISEFTHKLLEWLEEAFKYSETADDASRGDRRSRNPMISLFYGQHKTEGVRDGLPYTQTETFGQFPLTIVPGCDLHQAIEASVTPAGGATAGAGAHQWFTVLPPVLLLELNRFKFDQSLNRTEKLHDPLTFPAQMYLDRYLEINKNVVTLKRAEIAQLRRTRRDLNRRLDQYLSFGASAPRVPLSLLLRHTLQYSRSGAGLSPQDVEMEAAASSVTGMVVDSPASSPPSGRRLASSPAVGPAADLVAARLADAADGDTAPAVLMPPQASAEELVVVQRCLERWAEEVDREIKQLKRQIQDIDVKIEHMFNEPVLQQVPYRLHAVLVHEGQAGSGHYWAYVLHPERRVWMKFNDNTVTESDWETLCKESVGGRNTTSAYSLVYIDVNRHELMDDRSAVDKEAGMVDAGDEAARLPLPLQQYVDEDNIRFQKEVAAWSQQQQQSQAADAEDAPMEEDAASRRHWTDLSARHAALSISGSLEVLRGTVSDAPHAAPNQHLSEAIRREVKRLRARCAEMDAEAGCSDHRMTSMGVYLLRNRAAVTPDLRWMLLQHYTHPAVGAVTSLKEMFQLASKELWEIEDGCSEEEKRRFRCWHVHYNEFRWVAWSTVLGLGHLTEERYTEALLYLLQAYRKNEELLAHQSGPHPGLDADLLASCRRKAILGLNKQAVEMFLSGRLESAARMTHEATVPALVALSRSQRDEDLTTAEHVRNKWCSLLEHQLDESSQGVLQEIITQLIEPTAEHEPTTVPIKVQAGMEQQLAVQYREYLSRFKQDG